MGLLIAVIVLALILSLAGWWLGSKLAKRVSRNHESAITCTTDFNGDMVLRKGVPHV